MARHTELTVQTGVKVYFCATVSGLPLLVTANLSRLTA